MELNRDGDGFLINTSDWSEEVMYEMAKSDDMEITEEIKTYINKAREMFNATGTVPAVRIFAKEFGMDRKASKLYDVFKSGPMKKIAKYGGLPKPTGCV
jgi:TusE/DsrC/DsvC family sulfur relay protein|tara:strand:+ start:923 stop:1219 length:297 start_codon:yes stop_codon:yes gene_type:complete